MHKYCQLVLDSVNYYLKNGSYMQIPKGLPDQAYSKRAGVFTSLHNKKDNSLRGCIGTFAPTKSNIAEEIIYNAVAAAFEDPRFHEIEKKELKDLRASVDILTTPEKCKKYELNPKKYGVIVSRGEKSGLLLPDLPEIDDAEYQISIAAQKAGILYPEEDVELERFKVERYE